QEVKATRPKAAVTGIKLDQPAPVREERPREQLSFLDKFFSLFRPTNDNRPETTPDSEQAQEIPSRTERGRGRRDRNRSKRNKAMLTNESSAQPSSPISGDHSPTEASGILLQGQI